MCQVPMEQIRPGEKIRVDAGNVIPVDGTVLSGEAEVNQAAMTGESEAASKREGSVVFAGTTLETGSLVHPGWTPQETSPALTISSP